MTFSRTVASAGNSPAHPAWELGRGYDGAGLAYTRGWSWAGRVYNYNVGNDVKAKKKNWSHVRVLELHCSDRRLTRYIDSAYQIAQDQIWCCQRPA